MVQNSKKWLAQRNGRSVQTKFHYDNSLKKKTSYTKLYTDQKIIFPSITQYQSIYVFVNLAAI